MEQQYTRITTSLFEAIQKVTSGVSEQKQEMLLEEKKEETEEQIDEAKGLASMTMDQLKQEHEKVKNKIETEGKSKMISMNHPLSQRARLIKLHMMIKNKQSNEEVEQTDEAMSHQAATTLKHIKPGTLRQNYGDKQDAANIKPGIKGVADRLAMLDRAKKEGRLKEEEEQFDETIIKEDLNFEVPEQFSFQDYLRAVTSLSGTELEEHEVVAVAYEAFRTQEEDIVLEELTRDDLKQKMKAHMDAGHQISGEKFSMKDGKPYGEYVVTDKETGVRRKYIHHGTTRKVENMGARTKKDAKAND